MGRHGNMNMNMNKNGGGNANGNGTAVNGPAVAPANGNGNGAAEKTVLNQYMTWSVALNAAKSDEDIKEKMKNVTLSKAEDKTELSFDEFFKKGADAVDLGGGDQGTILKQPPSVDNLIRAAIEKAKKNAKKEQTAEETTEAVAKAKTKAEGAVNTYRTSKTIFTTGGSDDKRLQNLAKLKTAGVNKNVSALTLENETKLTAVSYYDYAQKLLESNYDVVCGIPIGSTDIHLIIYNKNGTVETGNLGDYNDETYTPDQETHLTDLQTKLGNIKNQKVLYVFGGSARYTMIFLSSSEARSMDFTDQANKNLIDKKSMKVLEKIGFFTHTDSGKHKYMIGGSGSENVVITPKAFDAVYFGASNGTQAEAETQVNGNQPPPANGNGNPKNQEAEAPAAEAQGNGSLFSSNKKTKGGKRRRTKKASQNKRKTVKAKNMRRKNKSSKGKKSKTSRRR